MNSIAPKSDLQAEFLAYLEAAARAHAGEFHIRLDGDRAMVIATVRGEPAHVTTWSAGRCEALLRAAFSLCDGAGDYDYGSARSMRMTGANAALPEGVSMVLVQFMPPKDGGRHLVVRLTYQGDVCCGSCGGS